MSTSSLDFVKYLSTSCPMLLNDSSSDISTKQCCLLTANIACHENDVPKFSPIKWRFVKKITLKKVNTLNIRTKQYIIPFYPLHLSKFHIHDPIVFLQCVAHPIRLELNLLNVSFHLFDEILLREPSLTRKRARWSNQSSVP